MSHTIRRARRLAAACLTAAFAVSIGASSASAEAVDLAYSCKLPLVGTQPATIRLTTNTEIKNGVPASPFFVSGLTLTSPTSGPTTALSDSRLDAHLDDAEVNQDLNTNIGGKIPLVLGTAPTVTFPVATVDGAQITFGKLVLNLRSLDASGQPVVLPPITRDLDGNAVRDSDGLTDTYNAYCKLVQPTVVSIKVALADPEPPTTPGPITITNLTQTSATLNWGASTDNIGLARYVVTWGFGSTFAVAPTQTSYTLTGLLPNTEYDVSVAAFDTGGSSSPDVAKITFTTAGAPPSPVGSHQFNLEGSLLVPSLAISTTVLRGQLNLRFTGTTGAFSGDFVFQPLTARLVNLTNLPITAKVAIVPASKTTGTVVGGVLNATTKARLKVLDARLFGAIPIEAGNGCQSKALINLKWTSTNGPFSAEAFSRITSDFDLSDLNGCFGLDGLVNPATASTGNNLALSSTPIAAPAAQ